MNKDSITQDLLNMARQTAELQNAISGVALSRISDPQEFQKVLADNQEIFVTSVWGEGVNQMVAEKHANGRLYFFNPQADHSLTKGELIGGTDGTPARRVEDDGIESMSFDTVMAMLIAGQVIAQVQSPLRKAIGLLHRVVSLK